MPRLTETRAKRAKLPEKGLKIDWCSEIKTFGARYTPGSRTWVVQPRCADGTRPMIALGPVGTLPFEGPPDAPGAKDLALAAINAARRGEDPRIAIGKKKSASEEAAKGLTLDDIWQQYVEAGYPKLKGVGRKRASTVRSDRDRYSLHFRRLGKEHVAEIDTARVRRWLDKIESEGQRNHCLVFLKSLRSFALSRDASLKWPPIEIKAAKSKEVQDFYSAEELDRLDAAIVELIAELPHRIMGFSALRLLLMSGARKSEILSLRWADLDLEAGAIHLKRDKTSDNRRDILLPPEAVTVLEDIPRSSSPFVFFADSAAGHTLYVEKNFREAIDRAGLRRVRIHDLRHSFASASIRGGNSLYVTGRLLGHRQAQTSQRYSHLEHDVARAALDRVRRTVKREDA
jgi:integrase